MSATYAHALLQRGMGVQDAAILSGCNVALVRAMRPKRREYVPYAHSATYGPPIPTRKQQIDATIKGTALRYGLTVEDLMGECMKRRIAWPRQEAMYMLRTKFELSYPRIGEIFGRDHSTVMSGCRHYMMRAGVPARLATGWDLGREGGK